MLLLTQVNYVFSGKTWQVQFASINILTNIMSAMASPDSTEIMLHLQRDRNMKIQIQKYNALLADAASATFRLDEQGGWGASGFCH